jgi:hypothetical protein
LIKYWKFFLHALLKLGQGRGGWNEDAGFWSKRRDWTLSRPPHLKDDAHIGKYQQDLALEDENIKGWVSRSDLADFMLKQLEHDRYIRQAPRVSY